MDQKFLPTSQDLGELAKIMFEAIADPKRIGALFNVQKNIANGDKVIKVADLGLQGKKVTGCDPDWDTANLTSNKTWAIGAYGINLKTCWADVTTELQRRIKNAEGADLKRNIYLAEIVKPRVEVSLEKMYTRLGFFGSATSQASKLTTSTDSAYFLTNFEGVFPYATTYVASHPNQLVSVSANAQATYAAQKAAMLVPGVATGILDDVIMSGSPALRQASDQVIFMTLAMADALDYDIRKNNKGSELQWKAIGNGVKFASYNGVETVAVPAFDEVLSNFKEADRAPFRAIYTTKHNLMLGMHGDNEIAEVRVDYESYRQLNLISALDHFGAIVAQDDLFVLAI